MAVSNTVRYLAPGSGKGPSTTHGAKPSNSPGGLVDLPDNSNDCLLLTANGWAKLGYVGTTAQRPTTQPVGSHYIDTTLSKTIFYDGVSWRDCISGSVV